MLQYLSENFWLVWTLISILCLILELTNGDFFIICFSIGGLFAAVAAAIGVNGFWQIGIFALFSLLSIFFVRPTALRYLHRNKERVSNADAIIGREGVVSEAIEAGGYGRVAIDGDDWKALSSDGGAIEKGEKVVVKSRDSIIITVERYN